MGNVNILIVNLNSYILGFSKIHLIQKERVYFTVIHIVHTNTTFRRMVIDVLEKISSPYVNAIIK